MLQGTGSSVGKSVLCAALCRIFARRGLRVAPFKSQNMSNNAYVTVTGGEISRAQVVQAEAAGVEPTVEMNPVLLKPEGERGSQVVVLGRVWGHLRGTEFVERKRLLWDPVERSLRTLLERFDLVVIEGAGSPAEINLKAGDIVNMRVAQAAEAPVLLVGDIDRGGVFASLVGTLELLDPAERDLVAGFVINRFRGDPALLQPGLAMLEQRTGRPVLGVVPYLADLGLPEEDAAPLERGETVSVETREGSPRVAAIRLPRLANFDDLDPLVRAGAAVVWVDRPEQLAGADLIVVPGSKATGPDLAWLWERGLAAEIVELVDRGTPILGLCGGYQMLGEVVKDPERVESELESVRGLELLSMRTTLATNKTTRQATGRVLAGRGLFAGLAGAPVQGYEIHVGRSEGPGEPLLELNGSGRTRADGHSARSGWVVGTYVHGLLASRGVAEAVVHSLVSRRGLRIPERAPAGDPLDRLADEVERALDLEQLFRLVGRLELASGRSR
jgi:adenosylcobyric acid synthase